MSDNKPGEFMLSIYNLGIAQIRYQNFETLLR
jgi:hypothetical protein